MGSEKKKKNQRKASGGDEDEGKQMITDPRFSSAHTDPRFRRVPRRESKVAIDSRFQGVFTDTNSAPVDKRGKRKRRASGNDSLKEFYRIEKDKTENEEEEEEEEDLKSKAKGKKLVESSEGESEEDIGVQLASSSDSDDEESEEEEEEEDTDEEDEADYDEEDGFEILDDKIETIDKETHRLAIVNMDWRYVSAKDLYVVLNSFLPKDGRIFSVAVYPTEFGLERMKEEEIHGPAIAGLKKNEDNDDDDEEEEEEDEEENNRRARDYEKSRLKYYHAVAVCDSSATADFLYKSCDGVEFERSSNKLDLRFIPDSMEFKHPHRDIATEAPSNYGGLDFQSRALQMSKVDISWDEDEPHRIKTLNQKFNPDQLADLEMKEFLASDSDESESDEDNLSKEEKRKEKYRALFQSGDGDSDKEEEEEEENDQNMEVTFNTGLEELSKNILKNKQDKKSETVWESYLRQRSEKKKARKNKQKDDASSPDDDDDDDDDDYNIDQKVAKNDDDFFMEERISKKKKKKEEGKTKKKKSGTEEEIAAEERSIAELELLVADDNAEAGNDLKGYNIKRKGKRGSKEIAEDKIPEADINDPRFAAVLSNPSYALDPTDPQFKRSATYRRQLAQKQKEDPRNHEEVKAAATIDKEELNLDGNMVSKKRKLELSSTLRSLKMKMQNKDSGKKKAGNEESSSTLAQRVKKKVKDLSKK